jgi:tRNA-dihydrouridine synthase B
VRGGGLLRDVPRIEGILGALREAVSVKFTVKTRLGFDDTETIDALVPLFVKHGVDLVTIHGRTVTQMYREGVRYDLIGTATANLPCPVLANGNIGSHLDAEAVTRQPACMVTCSGAGRFAIRGCLIRSASTFAVSPCSSPRPRTNC